MTNAGEISSITQYKNIAYIDIKNDPTTYVIFTSKILPLKKGENIKFEGKIEEYKGEKQFIILEIKKNI
jgi:DNA/RNA endonuclease YhcR with UshA esterase domain